MLKYGCHYFIIQGLLGLARGRSTDSQFFDEYQRNVTLNYVTSVDSELVAHCEHISYTFIYLLG